jgi:hypothetical protein
MFFELPVPVALLKEYLIATPTAAAMLAGLVSVGSTVVLFRLNAVGFIKLIHCFKCDLLS